jgi:hypothetical protein
MTSSSTPNVVIVVVVITRDSGQDAAPAATVAEDIGARTRHEHAQAGSSQSPAGHPG